MKSNAELFLEQIEEIFGDQYFIRKIGESDSESLINIFIYKDLPEPGMTTFITYGLSEGNHPEWKYGKPELILTLETLDESWGMAIGFFASQFRGIKKFSYGDLFTLDEPISEESKMQGFFVFAPAILDREAQKLELPNKTVHFAGMYPLYKEEVDLYQAIGLNEFWHLDGFDLFDVNRKNLAL